MENHPLNKAGIRILFSGDIAIQNRCSKIGVDNEVEQRLSKYNYRCCNFEAPICTTTDKPKSKIGPSLKQHPDSLGVVQELLFNMFALANNHIMDYGGEGLAETRQRLHEISPNSCFGAGFSRDEALTPFIIEKDGIRVGLMSVGENSFGAIHDKTKSGHAWIFDDRIPGIIRELKGNCDYVVLVCHAGAEHLDVPLPEWRTVYRTFIDKGVDAIIGHHPHVVQGWEEINGKPVFYSLGNFLWQKPGSIDLVNHNTVCVGLSFGGDQLKYETIPLVIENNKVKMNTDLEYADHLNKICEILDHNNESEYINRVDDFCLKIYENSFKRYLYSATGNTYVDSLESHIKMVIKSILKRPVLNNKFVYHNTAVETNNWIYQRAIRELEKL